MYDLLGKYIETYDYWYGSLFAAFDGIRCGQYERYIEEIFVSMIEFLEKDKSMQELIRWELVEDNAITRNSNRMREENTRQIIDALDRHFAGKTGGMNFRAFAAVIIAAVYFLTVHKGRATFCGIDFKSKQGRTILSDTVVGLARRVADDRAGVSELAAVAAKMKANGIDPAVIIACTGLDEAVIKKL